MCTFGNTMQPESESEAVHRRRGEVCSLLLFAVVLKTSAFAKERQNMIPNQQNPIKFHTENGIKMMGKQDREQ